VGLTAEERAAALRAAAVTVLPMAGRGVALRNMRPAERAATLRWMDPADVPSRADAAAEPAAVVERCLRRGDTAAAAAALERVEDGGKVRRLVAAMAPAERRAVLGGLSDGHYAVVLAHVEAESDGPLSTPRPTPRAAPLVAPQPDTSRPAPALAVAGGGPGGGLARTIGLDWLTGARARKAGPAY
jgi:hypothetical protein